jgi:hypothetical protein
MLLVGSLAAVTCRNAVHHEYEDGRDRATGRDSAVPLHWLGLSAALNRRCLSHQALLTEAALWAELTPFLLIPSEPKAVDILAEYAVFREHPECADIERLGLAINPALHCLDIRDTRLVGFLHDAMEIYRPRWLALLSFETLRWVTRALDAAHAAELQRQEASGREGPLWLKRGPSEVETEALDSLPR